MAIFQTQECDSIRDATPRTKRKHFIILNSLVTSTIKSIISHTKTVNEASRLCFGAFAGCFIVGALGWIANLLAANTTMLDGLLVVAVFYFVLGIIHLFENPTSSGTVNEQKLDFGDNASFRDGDFASEVERVTPAA